MRYLMLITLVLSLLSPELLANDNQPGGHGETPVNRDPDAAQVVSSDIGNFWRAYDAARPSYDPAVFDKEYFDVGSKGLAAFKRLRIDDCAFVKTLEQHPRYYESIRGSTLRVAAMEAPIRAAFRKFDGLYDAAVFPDVYFLIGCMNSGGTYTADGLLIGTEMYGRTSDMPDAELSDWHKAVLQPIDGLPHIVAHELIHYQQKYPKERALLGEAIKEGSADFLAELISGKHINPHQHEYGAPREQSLWEEFKGQMKGQDLSSWLYNGTQSTTRPADLGYYVGYKIVEAYYQNADDKRQAIKAILEINDFEQFLDESDYEDKFAQGVSATDCAALFEAHVKTDLTLSYQEFDQTEGKGFRVLAAASCNKQAADLIEAYIQANDSKQSSLTWHIAQLSASSGEYESAIVHARQVLLSSEDFAKKPLRWNDYVLATIAFLEGDWQSLVAHRDRVAEGVDAYFGNKLNLALLNSLIRNFGRSYEYATSHIEPSE